MLLFALFVFALLGVAALALDVGSALLAQGQMQNAVDAAALQGVRLRDADFEQWYSDFSRRERVAQVVRFDLDDDFHPTQGSAGGPDAFDADDDDRLRFTVGPSVALVGGSAQDNIGATIDESVDPYLDDPELQHNSSGNRAHGDMLSGTFVPNAAHQEDSSYARPDFVPGDPTQPSQRQALGFLVRMRRSSQPNALDRVPGTSSAGPGIPFLFGLGTAIHRAPGDNYNPRTMGLTVRATAIAAAAPALAVSYSPCVNGAFVPDPLLQLSAHASIPLMGYYGVALDADFWKAITDRGLGATWISNNYNLQVNAATGELTLIVLPPQTLQDLPGWEQPWVGLVVGKLVHDGRSVGDRVTPVSLAQFQNGIDASDAANAQCRWAALQENDTATLVERGYLAISQLVDSPGGAPVERVIGYGFGKLVYSSGSSADRITLSPGLSPNYFNDVECWSGQSCASAHLSSDAESLDPETWRRVFDALDALVYDIPTGEDQRYDFAHIRRGTLLASTLVR